MKNTYTKEEVLQIARDAYSLGYSYSANIPAIDSTQTDDKEDFIKFLINEFERIHGFTPWE